MATILLLAVLFGSLVAIILMVYLIDRVKRLEIISLQINDREESQTAPTADNGFLGLYGKPLWDAMSGKVPEGFNESDLVALKPRFAFVLQNHIEMLFKLGKKDAAEGKVAGSAKNPLDISTLRGTISSWLPTQSASTLYNAGYASFEADEIAVNRLRTDIDEIAGELYVKAGLTNSPSFSDKLLSSVPAVKMPSSAALDDTIDEHNEE